MKIIDFPKNLTFHVRSNDSEFYKEFKRILSLSRITYYDPCCDELANIVPLRYDIDGGAMQYFNTTLSQWASIIIPGTTSDLGLYSSNNFTAFAGGGQGSATLLDSTYNRVTVSATTGDSIKLPPTTLGKVVIVRNDGATAIDVFPFLGSSINSLAVNLAVRVAPKSTVVFNAVGTTVWKTNNEVIGAGDGAVALPGITFASQPNMGFYKVSSTQLGASVSGALVGGWNASGLFTGAIAEQVGAAGVQMTGKLLTDKGTITQITSKTTTVVLDKSAGVITTVALTDAADTSFEFTFTNSLLVATSVVQLTVENSGTGVGVATVTSLGAGTGVIRVNNVGVAAFNSVLKIHFTVS